METVKTAIAVMGAFALTTTGFVLSAGDVETGKKEYDTKCAICHGPSGKGDGPYVPQLKVGSSDITMLSKKNDGEFPTAQVFAVLDGRSEVQAHGPRDMPIWGEVYLSEGPPGKTAKEREPFVNERLHALIAYLETLQVK